MSSPDQRDGQFVHCGRSAYALLLDGELRGVLYWTEEIDENGEEDEEVFCWCWMDGATPHSHLGLETPPLLMGMTQEQVEANISLAMETLEHLITRERMGLDG